jgi:hypothetical protein
MRTSEPCNTSKKAASTRWPPIWEQDGDIPFSKSSRRRKTPLDGRFGERSDRGGRATLRFWWPIRGRLKACWDGPPSAISPTSCRVRGPGCRKTRTARERIPSGFFSCQSSSLSRTLPRRELNVSYCGILDTPLGHRGWPAKLLRVFTGENTNSVFIGDSLS